MAPRSAGRSWATEQLFTKTKTSIYAVQWYELAARDITEVEVGDGNRGCTACWPQCMQRSEREKGLAVLAQTLAMVEQ
jgi:hypothetical protein